MLDLDSVKKSIKNKFMDPEFILNMAKGVFYFKNKDGDWNELSQEIKQKFIDDAVLHVESMFGNKNEYRILLSFYLNEKDQKNMDVIDIIFKSVSAHLMTFQDPESNKNRFLSDFVSGKIPGKGINGIQEFEYDENVNVNIFWHFVLPAAAEEWQKALAERHKNK